MKFLLRNALAGALLAFAWCAVAAPVVEAGILGKNDVVKLTRDGTVGHAGGGGEFAMYKWTGVGPVNVNAAADWQLLDPFTFCLEMNEYVDLNKAMVVGGVGNVALWGGNTQMNLGGVPVADATKVLFEQYATGVLSTETAFQYANAASANSLQQAIWDSQGYTVSTNALADQLISYAAGKTASNPGAIVAVNLFDVSAMNKSSWAAFDVDDSSTWTSEIFNLRKQDQLIYDPTFPPPPNVSAPEPSAMVIWGLAAVGLTVGSRIRRRRNS